jgi:hypothetical protein
MSGQEKQIDDKSYNLNKLLVFAITDFGKTDHELYVNEKDYNNTI